jgi:hypothetical protein
MAGNDQDRDAAKPTQQRGGSVPGEAEARRKGPWAATSREGVVPAELGGSEAPPDLLPEDPELGKSVLGRPARTDGPATDTGVDRRGGDHADAASDGGPEVPDGVEPDLKDAASGPRQSDVDAASRTSPGS